MKNTSTVPLPAEKELHAGLTRSPQDDRYLEAVAGYGPALERMTRGYESDPSRRQDLLQDIHLALWRSLAVFDGRCSLHTWAYRVAHQTAMTHVVADRRTRLREMRSLEDLHEIPDESTGSTDADALDLRRLLRLIERLKPLDRQVILMYLEGFDATSIADVVGLTAAHVATKVHRVKKLLASLFHQRDQS